MTRCRFTPHDDGLALASPYDQSFVESFKLRVPSTHRVWNRQQKAWIISPLYAAAVADLCAAVFGERPTIPAITTQAAPTIKVFQVLYLGQCKQRPDDSISAMGFVDGSWSLVMPESVLRLWFEGSTLGATPTASRARTYYGLLGVPATADEATIKAGYKRMARQWHPDVCSEPQSHEMFLAVRTAYDTLKDRQLRKRYDAGLAFSAPEEARSQPGTTWYRAPLRCGLVIAEAVSRLSRWHVQRILGWNDILDAQGRVMVASWNTELECIRTEWIAS
jgi:hypothetical protein